VIDPSIKKTLRREDFHVSDYSPWEGWAIEGWPVMTLLRGKVIADNGKLLGTQTDGRLLTGRRIEASILSRPAC
jgi:dihydropyrimidinase